MKSKELRAQRAKLVEDARAILDAPDAAEEANAQFDAMMVEADALNAKIERFERADAEMFAAAEALRSRGEREGVSADEAADRQAREDDAFTAYMRGGFQGMTEAQRAVAMPRFQAAQGTTTGSSGGYTIPDTLSRQIDDAMKAYGGMMDVSYVFTTASGNPLAIPTDNDTTHSGSILTENTQVTGQDVTFGSVTLGAYTYTSKLVLVSNQLLQDSIFDLGASWPTSSAPVLPAR
jgi:HK97 family phage major capsid protein